MTGEDELRQCGKCGGELNGVEWIFDPCPEDEDGEHGPASLAARLRHGYRTLRGYARSMAARVLEVTGIAALARKIAATRSGRVALAVWRFAWGRIPGWLRRCLAFALAIPGPVDELAGVAIALVFVLVPLVVSAGARGELAASVRGAWNGETQVTNT